MDAESLVIGAIYQATAITCYHAIPANRPAEFGTVERTGGETRGMVLDEPLVTIRLYAATRARASQMAALVKDAIEELPFTEQNVFQAGVLSDYKSNDLEAMLPCHVVNCSLVYNN